MQDIDIEESLNSDIEKLKTHKDPDVKIWSESSDIEFVKADITNNIRDESGISPKYLDKYRSYMRANTKDSFSTVTCFSDIGLYFQEYQHIHNIFKNVKENIQSGGYFIMTCLDGELVYRSLKQSIEDKVPRGVYKDTISNKSQEIWRINPTNRSDLMLPELSRVLENGLGNQIEVTISGEYTNRKEYLVHPILLINIAAAFGLHILSDSETSYNFKNIDKGTGLFGELYSAYTQDNYDVDKKKSIFGRTGIE